MGQEFDVILRGLSAIDGSGAPTRIADLGLRDERIAAVGDLSAATAPRQGPAAPGETLRQRLIRCQLRR